MAFQKGFMPWNKGKKIKFLCRQCGKSFEVLPYRKGSVKFCSKSCFFLSKKGKQTWHKEKIKCNCLQCKKDFYVLPSRITHGKDKYCSFKCYWESKKGKPSCLKGKHLSKKHKKQLSKTHKGIHPINYYKEIGLKGVIRQQNSKEPTSIEKKVYKELKIKGFLFETQKLINGKFLVDAYIPILNLVIEADGNYWHSLDRIVEKDKTENAYLKKCGFGLLRLTETEINNDSFKERINKIGRY